MNVIREIKEDSGAVLIVEATIIFPIMFFVLFFIIFAGNLYYQQARVDDLVARYAIKGANRIVNPLQKQLDEGAVLETDSEKVKVEPYRSIFGFSMGEIEKEITDEVYQEISSRGLVIFGNSPEIGKNQVSAKYHNYVLYGNFSVEASYQIRFPIKFIGSKDVMMIKTTAYSQVTVNDVPEFIRNTDLVVDLFTGTKFGDAIKNAFQKINEFIGKFS